MGYERMAEKRYLTPEAIQQLRDMASANARQDFEAYTKASTDDERRKLLSAACIAAFRLGELRTAEALAQQALTTAQSHSQEWFYGNLIHYSNVVSGLLALQSDDTARAVEHLHQSVASSPQLDSFGPCMLLAGQLLERGEREAVISYVRKYRPVWNLGAQWLDVWEDMLSKGQNPNFAMHSYR